MLKKVITPLVFLVLFTNTSSAQSLENLEAINTVWSKFYQAFDSFKVSNAEVIIYL